MESAISRKTGARRFSRTLVDGAAVLFLGAGGVSRPSSLVAAQSAQEFGAPWLTVEEYEIGEGVSGGGDAAFSLISAVRVLEGGGRILVVEAAHLRVTIWTPDGSLVREVGGPGEGPGEFSGPLFAQVRAGGIYTRDARRYTAFSSDGELIGTTPLPPPGLRFEGHRLRPRALLADGSFLAVADVPPTVQAGFGGGEPVESVPVLHLRAEDDQWELAPIARLDIRNRDLFILPTGRRPPGIQTGQFYSDHDLTWYDPEAGSVVVLRRNLGRGEVELLEIGVAGDTAWHRRLSPPAVRFRADQVAAVIDDAARNLAGSAVGQGVSVEEMREALEDALYIPDPMPGATRMHGTASGEVWFRGYQRQDSLAVWYAAGRDGIGLRQVLLPPGFRPMDASDSHVWGVRRGELGVEYVVRRRLVPPADAGPSR